MWFTTQEQESLIYTEYKDMDICCTCHTLIKRNKKIDFCWGCWMVFKWENKKLKPTGKHVNALGKKID